MEIRDWTPVSAYKPHRVQKRLIRKGGAFCVSVLAVGASQVGSVPTTVTMTETIYIVTGRTESGDTISPRAFRERPTNGQLRDLCEFVPEDGPGPGNFGSYTYLTVTTAVLA